MRNAMMTTDFKRRQGARIGIFDSGMFGQLAELPECGRTDP